MSSRRGNINHATIEANGRTRRKEPRMPSYRQVLRPICLRKRSIVPTASSFEVASLPSIDLFLILMILTIMFSPNYLATRKRSPTTEGNIFSQKKSWLAKKELVHHQKQAPFRTSISTTRNGYYQPRYMLDPMFPEPGIDWAVVCSSVESERKRAALNWATLGRWGCSFVTDSILQLCLILYGASQALRFQPNHTSP